MTDRLETDRLETERLETERLGAEETPPPRFVTIGHSDRPLEAFVGDLRAAGVATVADVRRHPGSRHSPQFGEAALAATLQAAGIGYERIPGLGGRRASSGEMPESVNAGWRNRSFHNYADHASTDEFARGLARLRAAADAGPVAVMCAEAVWWRCHRRIIADHLLAAGERVEHVLPGGRVDPASLTPGAVVTDGRVTYPVAGDAEVRLADDAADDGDG